MKKKLFIYTAATAGYDYALLAQARRIIANVMALGAQRREEIEVHMCWVVDANTYVSEAKDLCSYSSQIDAVHVLEREFLPHGENYKINAQLLIAQMRTEAINLAHGIDAEWCWSLDSDVLPPSNSLRCMLDMLGFDGGYYGAAFCPYPSQGGGSFLGGRGTPQSQILPDVYEDEKVVPPELIEERQKLRTKLENKPDGDGKEKKRLTLKEVKEISEKLNAIEKQIRELPSEGNVFHNNAKGWRKRGWFDAAYPAIGKGAIVPTDWTGMGCILMGRAALTTCDWSGYDGRGTEDLFINYQRWAANGIRICMIPHCPCDHVIRHPKNKGEAIHIISYHEHDGECEGHLRQRAVPWYSHRAGERESPTNDGDTTRPEQLQELAKPEKP